ncbi:MAG: diadenylate cyclase CdaA [Planctomycetota bacterium]|jgi:diadenylate cyclase
MAELFRGVTTYLYRVGTTYNLVVVAAELLLIGLVVWWATRFLRGTRGARLVKGFVLLLVTVYVVIRLLPRGLPGGTVSWERVEFLYGKFLLFAFVAMVVAFQPELRRALIRLGQTQVFRSARGRVETLSEILIESLTNLSRNKVGAIIAVERTVGLGALAETGTVIDAELTPELLNTIFHPGSVLHDMAVIVSGDRVAAAGCQLPLAESSEVDPSLGSRHRAALGLAEESDAVVLVVSEETGRISLACDGQLYLGLELATLREMLLSFLSPAATARKRRSPAGGD